MYLMQLILLLLSFNLVAQTQFESMETAIDWLESNLVYDYYDHKEKTWWLNSVEFYQADSSIIYKNIFVKDDNKFSRKRTYYVRKIPLRHLNPHSIHINKVNLTDGRYTKGVEMVFFTTARKELISKSVNNRSMGRESRLRIIIPEFLTDSLKNLPEQIKTAFEYAIKKTQKTDYGTLEPDERVQLFFKSILGVFKWEKQTVEEGKSKVGIADNDLLFGNSRKIEKRIFEDREHMIAIHYLIYDDRTDQFFFTPIDKERIKPITYEPVLNADSTIRLTWKTDPESMHVFEIRDLNQHERYTLQKVDSNNWVKEPDSHIIYKRK